MVLGKVNSYYLCKSRFHWNIVKAVFVILYCGSIQYPL